MLLTWGAPVSPLPPGRGGAPRPAPQGRCLSTAAQAVTARPQSHTAVPSGVTACHTPYGTGRAVLETSQAVEGARSRGLVQPVLAWTLVVTTRSDPLRPRAPRWCPPLPAGAMCPPVPATRASGLQGCPGPIRPALLSPHCPPGPCTTTLPRALPSGDCSPPNFPKHRAFRDGPQLGFPPSSGAWDALCSQPSFSFPAWRRPCHPDPVPTPPPFPCDILSCGDLISCEPSTSSATPSDSTRPFGRPRAHP